jgi:hypothetical protein
MSVNFEEESIENNDMSREDLLTVARLNTEALAKERDLRKALEEKLKIATEALEKIADFDVKISFSMDAREALAKIKAP